jgi:fructose-specific phosphotransferase system IIC component
VRDLGLHLFLFVLAGTIIVAVSVMFTEAYDDDARRVFPRRWLRFFVGCAIVVGLMLLLEHTFAAVGTVD